MVEYHNKSFFGSKVGMFFDSGSWTSQHIFLKFIKKRDNGTWEKPSQKEGKSIKFSLEDLANILRVLTKEVLSWNTVHVFEENKTSISFEWKKGDKEYFGIKVTDYYKKLNYAETVVFKALLEHVFEEKIAHSTVNSKNSSFKKSTGANTNAEISELVVTEETEGISEPKSSKTGQASPLQLEKDPETTTVGGVCEGKTEKALLILFESGKQIWIPKSTIRSDFDSESSGMQQFTIDTWVLKKNEVFA